MTRRALGIIAALAVALLLPLAGPARAAGPVVTNVEVSFSPDRVPSERTTTVRVVATDADGNAVPGQTVALSAEGLYQFSRPTYSDGGYESTLVTQEGFGRYRITATVTSAPGSPTGSAVLTIVKPISRVEVSVPDGPLRTGDTTTVTVKTYSGLNDQLVDLDTGPAAGTIVLTGDGGQTFGSYTRAALGTYEVPMTVSKKNGTSTITAAVKPRSTDRQYPTTGNLEITQLANITSVTLTLDQTSLPADGTSTTGFTITLHGTKLPTDPSTITMFPGAYGTTISGLTPRGDGVFTGTMTASTFNAFGLVRAEVNTEDPVVRSNQVGYWQIALPDVTGPYLRIDGVTNGATYRKKRSPAAGAFANDPSGIADLRSHLRKIKLKHFYKYIYTAVATDKAGNTTTASVKYRVRR